MFVAVNIGGTKTLIAIFDREGKTIEQIKFPTPPDYEDFKKELAKTVAGLTTKDFTRVVTAVPGLLNRKEGLALAFGNLAWKPPVPIAADFEKIFQCPVMIENDTKLAGLSEAVLLEKKYPRVLYVTISTGISGAVITNGQIDPDMQDMEAGQLLLEHKGRLMDWEDFGSGKAFQAKFGKRVSDMEDSNSAAWYWLARNIAIGLIDLIATLTPAVIVIGGGVGAHLEKYREKLDEQLRIYENPMLKMPLILKAQRAEEAVIYGCYDYAKQHHEKLNRS